MAAELDIWAMVKCRIKSSTKFLNFPGSLLMVFSL